MINMGMLEGLLSCLKMYLAAIIIFAIVFYVIHVFHPYDCRHVPKDFIPPEKWLGSFSKGQFVQYIMAVFLFPFPFALTALLTFWNISSDISITISAVLLLAIMFLSIRIERKIDRW